MPDAAARTLRMRERLVGAGEQYRTQRLCDIQDERARARHHARLKARLRARKAKTDGNDDG